MVDVRIDKISTEVIRELKRRAKLKGISLNDEMIFVLEEALKKNTPEMVPNPNAISNV
jgi:hypothetical protein